MRTLRRRPATGQKTIVSNKQTLFVGEEFPPGASCVAENHSLKERALFCVRNSRRRPAAGQKTLVLKTNIFFGCVVSAGGLLRGTKPYFKTTLLVRNLHRRPAARPNCRLLLTHSSTYVCMCLFFLVNSAKNRMKCTLSYITN